MTWFLVHVLTCSLAIIALWNTFQPGEIFSGIGAWVRRKGTSKQEKPTVNCPVCMASFWGTPYYAVFIGPDLWGAWWHLFVFWVLFVFCVGGLNKIVVSVVDL